MKWGGLTNILVGDIVNLSVDDICWTVWQHTEDEIKSSSITNRT